MFINRTVCHVWAIREVHTNYYLAHARRGRPFTHCEPVAASREALPRFYFTQLEAAEALKTWRKGKQFKTHLEPVPARLTAAMQVVPLFVQELL